jgi:SAM-dependent methyltransferase
MERIDSVERFGDIAPLISSKPALKRFYERVYNFYSAALVSTPSEGIVVELGAGASNFTTQQRKILKTDVIPYPTVDRVVDATKMPFGNAEVSAFLMCNTFHHIPDVEAFLAEAYRCLKRGGKIIMYDQFPGLISKPILKYAHHEPFDDKTQDWKFQSAGPLSSANGALAWNVFFRDREKFRNLFPGLTIELVETDLPTFYWLSGGLKKWTVIPKSMIGFFESVDNLLLRVSPNFGSFLKLILTKS